VFILTKDRWNDGEHHDPDNPPARVPVGQVMRMPAVWLQIGMFFFMTGIEASAGNWTATIMTGKFDATESQAGIWAGIFWGAMAIGRIFMVPLSRDMNPARLVQLCTWGLLAGALMMTRDQVWSYQAGLIVFGLSMAPLFPTLMSLTPVRFGSQVALHTIGFQVSAATIGIIGITTTAGVIAQATTLTAIPWIMVIISVITIGLDMAIRRQTGDGPGTTQPA
jgi:fucose permease